MKKKQEELLEAFLYKLARTVFDNTPGLPFDWMSNRLTELADIFRPDK